MAKRSAAVAELETHLRDIVGPSGGLAETRWVGRLVELMRETANTEAREHLLKVVLATPDRPTLTRFVQLGGIELLGQWINEHRTQMTQEDRQVVHTLLSCLNKLSISPENMQRSEICKVVGSLSKHLDFSIGAKASSILAKWKKQLSEPVPSAVARELVVPLGPKPPAEPQVLELPKLPQSPHAVSVPAPVPVPVSEPSLPPQPLRLRCVASLDSSKPCRWVDDDRLCVFKWFYRSDEPNSQCASLRPAEENLPEPQMMSLDDFRKREDSMTRELSQKVSTRQERQAETQVTERLRNMRPVVTYTAPLRRLHLDLRLRSKKGRVDTQEAQELSRREAQLQKVTYVRESEIPRTPREPASKAETCVSADVPVVPLVTKVARPGTRSSVVYSVLPQMYPQDPMAWAYSYVPKPMDSKAYKSIPCKMFLSPQGCPRGEGCPFLHPYDWQRARDMSYYYAPFR